MLNHGSKVRVGTAEHSDDSVHYVRSVNSEQHTTCVMFPDWDKIPCALEQTSDTTHPPSPRLRMADRHGCPSSPPPLAAWELSEVRGRAPPLADQWVTSGHFPPNPMGLAGDPSSPFLGTESCFDNVRVGGGGRLTCCRSALFHQLPRS